MAHLKHLPADAPASDIIDEMRSNGGVIVDDFISSRVVKTLNQEIDTLLRDKPPSHGHPNEVVAFFHGPHTRHLTGVAGVSSTFVTEILLHPIYKAVGDAFLLPSCSDYILNLAHVLDRGPGASDQLIHRDQDVWPRELTRAMGSHVQFASLLALSDYTADMGATRVVPGSHLWEPGREARPGEIAVAEMAPGSAVLYFGSTLHGAGANVTDRMRRGMHVSYCLGWLRTEENNILSTPLERVREMPRRAQELLGFGLHDGIARGEGFLGALDNRNPIELIDAGEL